MDIHMRNSVSAYPIPVCWNNHNRRITAMITTDIDKVSCVSCLRMLAKDAVIYGNARRAKRSK